MRNTLCSNNFPPPPPSPLFLSLDLTTPVDFLTYKSHHHHHRSDHHGWPEKKGVEREGESGGDEAEGEEWKEKKESWREKVVSFCFCFVKSEKEISENIRDENLRRE